MVIIFTNMSTSARYRSVDPARLRCHRTAILSHQAFHVNPLTWAFRAAVLNEFQSPAYGDVCLPEVAEGQECPQDRQLGQVGRGRGRYG